MVMSLWIYGRRHCGRRPLYSVGTDPVLLLNALVIAFSLLLTAIAWLRTW
jgi:hypothetical protein